MLMFQMILHPVVEALPSWRSLFPPRDNFTTVDAPRLGEVTFHLNKVIPEGTFLLHCHLPHHLLHRFPRQCHNSHNDRTRKGGSESSNPRQTTTTIMSNYSMKLSYCSSSSGKSFGSGQAQTHSLLPQEL